MNDTAGFLAAIGDIPADADPDVVRRKSRDMTGNFSPVMKQQALAHVADVIVRPRDKADVLRIAAAAARTRMPLMLRGGGTANFGQGIPLQGGAVVDMNAMDRVLWTREQRVRAEAGARLSAIDELTRPTGWELRIHPSTKKASTLGGFVGGGHAGVGSCVYGILRDRGNILGLEVISVEDEPRVIALSGDDVNLVHHAYGSNGIITELEMPLAPAWAWSEQIVTFPEFMTAVRFAHALATSDGIIKKLISISSAPVWQMIRALKPLGGDAQGMALCMIATPFLEPFHALVRDFGGSVASQCAEGQGPYRMPLYEMAWGHARLHVNREHPDVVNLVGLYLDPGLIEAIERSCRRFSHLIGMQFEVKRFDGKLSFQGSPFFHYAGEEHLAAVMQGMADDGAMVANNHTFLVKEGGMKTVGSDDAAFKQAMDPYNLMNPGKLRFEARADQTAAGSTLPSQGWRYRKEAA